MDIDGNGRSDFLDDFEDQMAMNGYRGIYGGHGGQSNNSQQPTHAPAFSGSSSYSSSTDTSLFKMMWDMLVDSGTKKKIFKIIRRIFFAGLVISAIAIIIAML